MTQKKVLTVSEVMQIANTIVALGQPEMRDAMKLNLAGTLALSWNLNELNRLVNPMRSDATKRREALMSGGTMSDQNKALFDGEIETLMQKKIEVELMPIKPEDIVETSGNPMLAGVLGPLMGTVIDFSSNGHVPEKE